MTDGNDTIPSPNMGYWPPNQSHKTWAEGSKIAFFPHEHGHSFGVLVNNNARTQLSKPATRALECVRSHWYEGHIAPGGSDNYTTWTSGIEDEVQSIADGFDREGRNISVYLMGRLDAERLDWQASRSTGQAPTLRPPRTCPGEATTKRSTDEKELGRNVRSRGR
jgi:hypothetical protein